MRSSSAWVVDAVAAVADAVPPPTPVAVRSSTELADRPENSRTLTARAVTAGWFTVIVFPETSAVALCADQTNVRTLVEFEMVTSGL